MCNDYGNHVPYDDYVQAFSQIRVPVRFPASPPNLEPREDIWPTDRAPVIRRLEDGSNEFTELRWGFPPGRPKGAPVINFRSEGPQVHARPLPRAGIALFRVHRHQIAEVEMEIHQGGRGLVLLCRAVAAHAGRRARRFTLLTTEPSERRGGAFTTGRWLYWSGRIGPRLARSRPPRGGLASRPAGGVAACRAGAIETVDAGDPAAGDLARANSMNSTVCRCRRRLLSGIAGSAL